MVCCWNWVPIEVLREVTLYLTAEELLALSSVSRKCYEIAVLRFAYYKRVVIGIRDKLGYAQFKLYKEILRTRLFKGKRAQVDYLTFAVFLFQFQREELERLKKKFQELKLKKLTETVDVFMRQEQLIEDLNLLLFVKNIRINKEEHLFAMVRSNSSPSAKIVSKQANAIRSLLSIFGAITTPSLSCSVAGLTRIPSEHLDLRVMIQIDFSKNKIWKLPKKMGAGITYQLRDNPIDVVPFQLICFKYPNSHIFFSEEQAEYIMKCLEDAKCESLPLIVGKQYSSSKLLCLRRKIWQIRSEFIYHVKYGRR